MSGKSKDSVKGHGCEQKKVPTDDEVAALKAMKDIKNRVREVKRELRRLRAADQNGDPEAVEKLKQELTDLRLEWDRWERRRSLAAKARMIQLGHETE